MTPCRDPKNVWTPHVYLVDGDPRPHGVARYNTGTTVYYDFDDGLVRNKFDAFLAAKDYARSLTINELPLKKIKTKMKLQELPKGRFATPAEIEADRQADVKAIQEQSALMEAIRKGPLTKKQEKKLSEIFQALMGKDSPLQPAAKSPEKKPASKSRKPKH